MQKASLVASNFDRNVLNKRLKQILLVFIRKPKIENSYFFIRLDYQVEI